MDRAATELVRPDEFVSITGCRSKDGDATTELVTQSFDHSLAVRSQTLGDCQADRRGLGRLS